MQFTLALRNLLRQRRRSLIAATAVSVGVVALMLASGYIEWVYFAMREATIRSHIGHLQIIKPGFLEDGRSDPLRYLLLPDGPALEAVKGAKGIVTVAPRLNFSGLASHGETTVSFLAEAVSPSRELELSQALTITKGAALRDDDPNAVIFGVGLARNLGIDVGDRVVLIVNKANGGVNAIELPVRGLFSTITKAYDDAALRLPIATAQRLLGARGAHTWTVLLDDTDSTDTVATALRTTLPAASYQVVTWYQLADFYNKTVALFSRQVQVVKIIIAVIIVLSITNTMMMSVMERTGEIGTSMAMGVRGSTILTMFMVEGGLLGLAGGVIGIVLGLMLAALISYIGIPMPPPPGMGHGFIGEIRVTPPLALEAFVLAVATTLAASVYPAWRASHLAIVDAIRHNR